MRLRWQGVSNAEENRVIVSVDASKVVGQPQLGWIGLPARVRLHGQQVWAPRLLDIGLRARRRRRDRHRLQTSRVLSLPRDPRCGPVCRLCSMFNQRGGGKLLPEEFRSTGAALGPSARSWPVANGESSWPLTIRSSPGVR